MSMKIIYKITFPNGKIYIGKDPRRTASTKGSSYQWAEWLARERLGGALEANSKKAHDPVTVGGRPVQVKAGLVRDLKARGERQLSVFRSFDFDDCLIRTRSADRVVTTGLEGL